MISILIQVVPYVLLAGSSCSLAWVAGYIMGGQHMRDKLLDNSKSVRAEKG